MRKSLNIIIRLSVSIALILILLYSFRDKYDKVVDALRRTDIFLLLFSFLLFFIAVIISSIRLRLIITAQGASITVKECLLLTYVGYFFNNFLPTSIGGDFAKAYYLSKVSTTKMTAFTSVFIDRVVGLITMIFMAFVAVFFASSSSLDHNLRIAIYIIFFLSIIFVSFIFNKNFARKFYILMRPLRRFEDMLIEAYNTVHGYRHYKMLIVQSLSISVISQLLFFASVGMVAYSIGSGIHMIDLLLRTPVISVLSLLPSINGLGLREGATVVMFGPLIGKGPAFAVSILWLIILFVTSLIGGVIYLVNPRFKINIKSI